MAIVESARGVGMGSSAGGMIEWKGGCNKAIIEDK
jgi:hypothetical protein